MHAAMRRDRDSQGNSVVSFRKTRMTRRVPHVVAFQLRFTRIRHSRNLARYTYYSHSRSSPMSKWARDSETQISDSDSELVQVPWHVCFFLGGGSSPLVLYILRSSPHYCRPHCLCKIAISLSVWRGVTWVDWDWCRTVQARGLNKSRVQISGLLDYSLHHDYSISARRFK